MPLWKKALSIVCGIALLGGCARGGEGRPTLALRSAHTEPGTLVLALDCSLSAAMQDALDHGIPLELAVHLRAGPRFASARAESTHRLELRYYPLSRRYQLRDLDGALLRTFPASAYLADALGALRLPLPPEFATLAPGERMALDVALDRATLPGALQLPALIDPAWRVSATELVWTRDAG